MNDKETVDDTQDIDEAAEFADAFDNDAPESGTETVSDDAPVMSDQDDNDSVVDAPVSSDSSTGAEVDHQVVPEADFDPVKYQARLDSMSGRLSASDKRANELAAENERLKQQLEGDSLPDGEATEPESPEIDQPDNKGSALAELEEDFPEIAEAIKEAVPEPDPRLDAFDQWRQEQAMQAHVNTIAEAHPDFQEVAQSEALDAWINQQPSFLRTGYQQVRERGDAQQVIEMLDQYKGGRQNQNNSGSRRVAVKSGGRSVIPGGRIDKDDFDGGWGDGE